MFGGAFAFFSVPILPLKKRPFPDQGSGGGRAQSFFFDLFFCLVSHSGGK